MQQTQSAMAISAAQGPPELVDLADGVTLWSRAVVGGDGQPVGREELARRMRAGVGLGELGTPFAAVLVEGERVVAAADHVGMRHVFGAQVEGVAMVSPSALALAGRLEAELDVEALSVRRMTGQYLGEDTAFDGVRKLPAASLWELEAGRMRVSGYPEMVVEPVADPAAAHALRLRGLVESFVDSHDEVTLELSGGMDSRMVLAAIPVERRRGMRALTMVQSGGSDGPVASALAERYGMRHQLVSLDGLSEVDPQQAYELAIGAARAQDGLGAPLSAAAFGWAESQVEETPRLSGHGGEMARGTYYLQRPHPTVTPELVDRLARWWILANDAVAEEALTSEFAAGSRGVALRRIQEIFSGYRTDWLTACDTFFLRQRLHRWAGITVSEACGRRLTFNPLLDARVLGLISQVDPAYRMGSRYAVEVMERLDPELVQLPLGSGLKPVALTGPLSISRLLGENTVSGFAGKVASKVSRVFRAQRRPAVGAAALAGLVVRHWQQQPGLVEPVLKSGLVDEDWLTRMVAGQVNVDAPTVDFLLNLGVLVR